MMYTKLLTKQRLHSLCKVLIILGNQNEFWATPDSGGSWLGATMKTSFHLSANQEISGCESHQGRFDCVHHNANGACHRGLGCQLELTQAWPYIF